MTADESVEEEWKEMKQVPQAVAKEVYGTTKGGKKKEETWWWGDEVQAVIKEKKEAFKEMTVNGGSKEKYKTKKNEANQAVAKAKEKAWEEWYNKLETYEGEKNIYKIARHRPRQKKYIIQVTTIRDKQGRLLVEGKQIRNRRKEHFNELLNVENDRGELKDVQMIEGPVMMATVSEVQTAIKEIKKGKAAGSSGINGDMFKTLGMGGARVDDQTH